jgi:outer membrane receptor protein involved in Fe transport
MEISAGLRLEGEMDQMDYHYDSILIVSKKVFTKMDTSYNSLNSLQLLPKFAINYKLGNTNFYTTVSKGYKSGGFNNTFQTYDDLTYKPEYSWTYEIGAKTEFFDSKLYVDASLFLIDWKNQQVTRPVLPGGTMLKNAGNSQSKGFEISASTASIYGFELISAYGFTDAKFEKYIYKVDDKGTVEYSGNYIPFVPRHTVSAQLRKTIDVRQPDLIDKVIISTVYKGVGSLYWNDVNSAKQAYYNSFDARISFVRKNVQLDIWGSNLTNTKYVAYFFKTTKDLAQTGKPLQVGAKLAVKF